MATQQKRSARDMRQQSEPGRTFGDCRVSTVMQASEGETLHVQERQIAGYARTHGLGVERAFIERGVSGSKPLGDRPQCGELVEDAEQQAAVREIVRLRKRGLSLWKIAEELTADGVQIRHMGVKAVLVRAGEPKGRRAGQ